MDFFSGNFIVWCGMGDRTWRIFELTAEALLNLCEIQCGNAPPDMLIYRKFLCSKWL